MHKGFCCGLLQEGPDRVVAWKEFLGYVGAAWHADAGSRSDLTVSSRAARQRRVEIFLHRRLKCLFRYFLHPAFMVQRGIVGC